MLLETMTVGPDDKDDLGQTALVSGQDPQDGVASDTEQQFWTLVQQVSALCGQPPESASAQRLLELLQRLAKLCSVEDFGRFLNDLKTNDWLNQAYGTETNERELLNGFTALSGTVRKSPVPNTGSLPARLRAVGTSQQDLLLPLRQNRLLRAALQAIRLAGRGSSVERALIQCLAQPDVAAGERGQLMWPSWALAEHPAGFTDIDGGADAERSLAAGLASERVAIEQWLDALEQQEQRIERRLQERYELLQHATEEEHDTIKVEIERRALQLHHRQRNIRRALLNEMYLLVAPVETEAIAAYYRQRRDPLAEYGITSEAVEFGALVAASRRAARQRENEKLAYQRHRAEQEERRRARHARYLESLLEHGKSFRDARTQINQERQAVNRALHKHFRDRMREEERRARREEQERLRALRANDEEAYLRMLDATKNSRIMEVLRQTENYLSLITAKVQAQKDVVGVNEAVDAQGLVGLKAREAARKAQAAQRKQLREQERRMRNATDATAAAVDDGVDDNDYDDDGVDDKDDTQAPAENMLDAMRRRREEYYQQTHSIGELVEQQPSSLRGGQLKPYQIEGLQWMVSLYNNNLNGILADEMGLGKTIQTIALLAYLMEYKGVQGPHLIVVPLSTLSNWVREFRAWAPHMKMVVYRGDKSARRMIQQYEMASGQYNVLLTTYEYCVRDQRALSRIFWKYIIVDEGHRMKNTHCRLAMTLGVKYRSRNRLLLTGTPLQNNLTELWALLNFLLPNIFNSVDTFESWFSAPFQSLGTGDQPELAEEEVLLIINRLHHVLRPFLLRRLKTDVEDQLPEKREHVLRCDLSIWQKILYRQAKSNIGVVLNAGGKPRLFNNVVMQLKKVCNHPYLFYDWEEVSALDPLWIVRTSGKFELLDRMLPKLRQSGHRVLLFSQMTILLDVLEDFCKLRNFSYLRLDGSTKAEERHEMLELFNAPDNDIFLFMLSTRAGGLGLNLQTADTVILFDSDWNPQADLQAQDRAHRIGQRNEVRVFRLICADTVEERILAEANRKLNMDRQVIQAGKFNQKATDQERRAMLEELLRQQEGNEAAADVPDDETLNELLARTEAELELFEQIDVQRRAQPELYPPLLMDENELPDWVRQNQDQTDSGADGFASGTDTGRRRRSGSSEADDSTSIDRESRRRRAARTRTVLYDDGLTEGEWLRLLERGKTADDFESAIRERRHRKEMRRLRYQETVRRKRRLLRGLNPDDSTPDTSTSFAENDNDNDNDDDDEEDASAHRSAWHRRSAGQEHPRDRRRHVAARESAAPELPPPPAAAAAVVDTSDLNQQGAVQVVRRRRGRPPGRRAAAATTTTTTISARRSAAANASVTASDWPILVDDNTNNNTYDNTTVSASSTATSERSASTTSTAARVNATRHRQGADASSSVRARIAGTRIETDSIDEHSEHSKHSKHSKHSDDDDASAPAMIRVRIAGYGMDAQRQR